MTRRAGFMALALAFTLGVPNAVLAYEELNSEYKENVIGDNVLSVCYGRNQSEDIYFHRSRIDEELEDTWGELVGFNGGHELEFVSNGTCGTGDGSNLQILWDRSMECVPNSDGIIKLGYVNVPAFGTYSQQTIWLNADCNIRGKFDWTLSDGIDDSQFSARAVISHEFGHALGLGHSNVFGALMAERAELNDCSFRGEHERPSTDDQRGFWEHYDNMPQNHHWHDLPQCQD